MTSRKLFISFFVVFLVFLTSNSFGYSGHGKWFYCARAFLDAHRNLRTTKDLPSLDVCVKKGEESKANFTKCKQPSMNDIESLLYSPSLEYQIVGCVTVYLSGKSSFQIIKRLVEFLKRRAYFERRLYAIFALEEVNLMNLKEFEDTIFRAAIEEEDMRILLPLITYIRPRFPPERSSKILITLVKSKDDIGVKIVSYYILGIFGEVYKKNALEALARSGDNRILEMLKRVEKNGAYNECHPGRRKAP